MDKDVKASFNDDVVNEAARQFGIHKDALSFVGGFQNFIYEYQQCGNPYILRFTPGSLRSIDAVQAELEWILYLADNGVSASRPIPSKRGELVEVVDTKDACFIVASFEKARGKRIGYPECLSDTELFEKCGRVTGRMHALAKHYQPSDQAIRRHDWRGNYYLRNMHRYVPHSQLLVHEGSTRLLDEISGLPKDRDAFGLIHGDINVGNFFVSDAGLTLFDFDETQYSWFVEDMAIQLYYMVYVHGDDSKEERLSQAHSFMEHFLRGYQRENTLGGAWLKHIPLFLRLREVIVYTGMYRSFDMTNLDAWTKDYLSQSRVRIENGISIVELDL